MTTQKKQPRASEWPAVIEALGTVLAYLSDDEFWDGSPSNVADRAAHVHEQILVLDEFYDQCVGPRAGTTGRGGQGHE